MCFSLDGLFSIVISMCVFCILVVMLLVRVLVSVGFSVLMVGLISSVGFLVLMLSLVVSVGGGVCSFFS